MPRSRYASNRFDDDGNPAGGYVFGCGFTICWQDGPRGDGATIEAVLDALDRRMRDREKRGVAHEHEL